MTGRQRAGRAGTGRGGTGRRGTGRGSGTGPGEGLGPAGGSGPAGDADPAEAARQICLRLLTAAPRTRAQLATALRKRQIPDEVADDVLGRFADVGLIDDAAFAQAWVDTRHHGRGLARRALSAELRQRGVADDEVRTAVGSLGPQDEAAMARQLIARRVAATRGRPLPARVRHLIGVLARKGYPAGLAYQVVREALEQEAGSGLALALGPGAGLDLDEEAAAEAISAATAEDEWAPR
ncbi:MAG TPA: regulatory protein RecX [Streptosporangiaceae bacterium]